MKYMVGFAVAVVVFAAAVLILFNEELIFWQTFSYMATKIAGEGGIHPRLAEVIAVLYALVFAFAVTVSLHPERRRRGLIAIALMTALYSVLMYAMTRDANYAHDGKAIAFLEEQPDGTFVKTHRRRNAATNQPNTPVTPENERWADGKPAQRVEVTAQTHFFGGIEGKPLLYYARRGTRLEFFDRLGAHPQTRERLREVTPAVADEALAMLPQAAPSNSVVDVRPLNRAFIAPDMKLFDAAGNPLYWFDPQYEEWELYDGPGAHPRTGRQMVPLGVAYAGVLRHAIAAERRRNPQDLTGHGLQELRKYSHELSSRTAGGS